MTVVLIVASSAPKQVTLVPDATNQLTSNHGWDTIAHHDFLKDIIQQFQSVGIRVSIFLDANAAMIEGAKNVNTNRIELYTESYAAQYHQNKQAAILPYVTAAQKAHELGLEINAGHDLDLQNLTFFAQSIPHLQEVSIGHALVCDALYLGLENTVQMYKRCLV